MLVYFNRHVWFRFDLRRDRLDSICVEKQSSALRTRCDIAVDPLFVAWPPLPSLRACLEDSDDGQSVPKRGGQNPFAGWTTTIGLIRTGLKLLRQMPNY